MTRQDLLAKAIQTFGQDRFATEAARIKIVDVDVNYAKCELVVEDIHCNAMGAVMGGAIFTLADFCFAVAANCVELSTVSVSSSINFVNVARGKHLVAEAKCIKSGRKTSFFRISVTDELGTNVAEVTTTGCNVKC